MIDKAVTLTGIPVMEVPNALARVLPPAAYSEIKGTRKKGMTDTKPHFVRQRLTEIFGVCGIGWWVEPYGEIHSELDPDPEKSNPWTSTAVVMFYFNYIDENGETKKSAPVIGTGGISMDRRDFTERGAITNAISDCIKQMGWQKYLWYGLLDHKNAAEMYEKQSRKDKELLEAGEHIPGTPLEP